MSIIVVEDILRKMMINYNLELEALEGTITVVPALLLSAQDSDKIVLAPYGLVVEVIKELEDNWHPDQFTIMELEGNNKIYKFHFPPGQEAENALRALRWFRDMVEFAGPLSLGEVS